MIEVWQPERSTTIIRLDFLFAHSDGLPCRSLWEYGKLGYDANTNARSAAGAHHGDQQREGGRDDAGPVYLTTFKDKHGPRAWKSHSWDVLDRLHEGGYIHEPATKAKSVMLTEEGAERSK